MDLLIFFIMIYKNFMLQISLKIINSIILNFIQLKLHNHFYL